MFLLLHNSFFFFSQVCFLENMLCLYFSFVLQIELCLPKRHTEFLPQNVTLFKNTVLQL